MADDTQDNGLTQSGTPTPPKQIDLTSDSDVPIIDGWGVPEAPIPDPTDPPAKPAPDTLRGASARTPDQNKSLIDDMQAHELELYIKGDPVEDDDRREPIEVPVKDHLLTDIIVDGHEIPEKPYEGDCLEVKKEIASQLDKARYKIMEDMIANPLVVEEEVDGLRVKRMGAEGQIKLDTYLNNKRNALEWSDIQYFYVKSNGYF